MSDAPVVRASDADRERTITVLRDHAAEGRLTLEEFDQRMEGALAAVTRDELEALTRDLPVVPAQSSRRKPTRFVLSLFGSVERAGRVRVGRRVTVLTAFANVDLDLRQATFDRDEVTIVAAALFSSIDVYVPEDVDVDLHGLAIFGHKGEQGPDSSPPGAPVVHVYAFSFFAVLDVWRVPLAWMRRSLGDVIESLESRRQRELET